MRMTAASTTPEIGEARARCITRLAVGTRVAEVLTRPPCATSTGARQWRRARPGTHVLVRLANGHASTATVQHSATNVVGRTAVRGVSALPFEVKGSLRTG